MPPNDIAATLGQILGRDVRVEPGLRNTWESLSRSRGMQHPGPGMRMPDGFNEGWIAFEGGADSVARSTTPWATVLRDLVERHRMATA